MNETQTPTRLHSHIVAMVALEQTIEQWIENLLNKAIRHPEIVALRDYPASPVGRGNPFPGAATIGRTSRDHGNASISRYTATIISCTSQIMRDRRMISQ